MAQPHLDSYAAQLLHQRQQVQTTSNDDYEAGYWDHAHVLGKDPARKASDAYRLGWQQSKLDTRALQLPRGPLVGQC